MKNTMKFKPYALFLCALLALGSSAQALEVSAPSALLMEKETGTVLYEDHAHDKLEPASVTKIMTLLLVMEAVDSGRLSLDELVPVSAHAAGMGGSQVYLKEGEQLSVSGVEEVESFDENTIVMLTNRGTLIVRGEELHIEKLSLDGGDLKVEGTIDSLTYEDSGRDRAGGLFARLFR